MKKYRIKYPPKPKRKPFLHTALVPLLTLAAFAWLCDYSLDQQTASNDEIYAIIQSYEADKAKHFKVKKPHQYTKEQALYEVWNLTKGDITKPIYLFGKDGGKI